MKIAQSTAFHDISDELLRELRADELLAEKWNSLTDIQRNEWICWTTMAKQQTTRDKRLARAIEELLAGDRSPCCWPGCPHRRESAQKWFK